MKLKIAGGCGEHGRNCFYVESEELSFLVDCGVMAGEEDGGFPHLTDEEIRRISCVFLTHSHADHTGALPWLAEKDFTGKIIAAKHTLSQLPFGIKNALALENFCTDKQGELGELKVEYGFSGHCLGSVWYEFKLCGKTLLFSGDYTEDTFVHRFNPIRNRCADIAVIDCAYGSDKTPFEVYCDTLIHNMAGYIKMYPMILMPVPKYGRGLELYQLLKKYYPHFHFMADRHFINQCRRATSDNPWFKIPLNSEKIEAYSDDKRADIIFVSDPQLRSAASQRTAQQVIKNGFAVMTGTVESGTMSEELIKHGKMSVLRFPVHLNYEQYKRLIEKNNFKQTIPYHSPEFNVGKIIEF